VWALLQPFPELGTGVKPHVSIVDTFTITTNHLVVEMLFYFERKSIYFQDLAEVV